MLRCRNLPQKMLREYLDIRRPKKQDKGEEGIMMILTMSTLNADQVAVGYVGDVSEEFSTEIFCLSEEEQNLLKLKKQVMKRRCRKKYRSVGE
jgi:cytochrome b